MKESVPGTFINETIRLHDGRIGCKSNEGSEEIGDATPACDYIRNHADIFDLGFCFCAVRNGPHG